MKKTYIAPQSVCISLYAEESVMMTVSGGQTTGGFGAKTQSADENFSEMPWAETESTDAED